MKTMKKFFPLWLAASGIAVMMFIGLVPATARAGGVTTEEIGRVLSDALDPVRKDVGELKNRVSGLEGGAGGATASGASDERVLAQAGVDRFCREVASAAYGKRELEAWATRLATLRGQGYAVSDSCLRRVAARIDSFDYPAPPAPDLVRPQITVGIQATDGVPVGFPVGLGFGNRSFEGRLLAGVSTEGGKPLFGADLAVLPLHGERWDFGVGARATAITAKLDESSSIVIAGGPRLRWHLDPCAGGGYAEVGVLLGEAVKDRDPGAGKESSAQFTGGGNLDLGWAF